jgi:amphi-Trp domain-containing protein
MTEFQHEERLPRRRAAELLTDVAYALAVGDTLEVRTSSRRVTVPVGDTVLVTRESRADRGRVEVEVRVRWSVAANGRGDG